MSLDFSRSRLTPFAHQIEDTQVLIDHPYLLIASEMRTGKSKIVVDAVQFLFESGIINRIIVMAPAAVRDVWYDPVLGEIRKHGWLDIPNKITEFHTRIREWSFGPAPSYLHWMVSNYEFLRSKNRLAQLLTFCGPRTLLVGDESSFLKNWTTQQTRSFVQLRKACGRIVLLNGTPISQSLMDLFSQGNILHPSILDCKSMVIYKARYAIQEPILKYGGKPLLDPHGQAILKVTGWTNVEDIQRRFAPYIIRRLQKDCLDLPPKLDAVTMTAELTDDTWRMYKEMRDEFVVWLKHGNVATAPQAAVKILRLSQMTSGFLGGVENAGIEELNDDVQRLVGTDSVDHNTDDIHDSSVNSDSQDPRRDANHLSNNVSNTMEIGREKLDVLLWFLGQRLEQDENLKAVSWCRFRPEMFRMMREVSEKFPQFQTGWIAGSQKKADRLFALSLLKPETAPKGPVLVGGIYGTGSYGLDFTAANTSINCSFDYSVGRFKQSGDRIYGPGMIGPAAYFDIVAVGPRGQRTIDHVIVETRRTADDIATWTTAAWVSALTQE